MHYGKRINEASTGFKNDIMRRPASRMQVGPEHFFKGAEKQMKRIRFDSRVWPGVFLLGGLVVLTGIVFRTWPLAGILAAVLCGHLSFFRDPDPGLPEDDGLVSPAAGKVIQIERVREDRYLKEEAFKIGVFLSLLDNHVTRSPIEGTVDYLSYERGKFYNALRDICVSHNESNWLGIRRGETRILIRQMAGMIARRIYCDVKEKSPVQKGGKLGIICYGSRVEFFAPVRCFKPSVVPGVRVKGGETILGNWVP